MGSQPCSRIDVSSMAALALKTAQLSSCNRQPAAHKAYQVYNLTLYRKRLPTAGLGPPSLGEGRGPAASASPRSLLEHQNLGPHPRPAEVQSALTWRTCYTRACSGPTPHYTQKPRAGAFVLGSASESNTCIRGMWCPVDSPCRTDTRSSSCQERRPPEGSQVSASLGIALCGRKWPHSRPLPLAGGSLHRLI